jgi:hypothetical protein
MTELQVGSIVIARRETTLCKAGEPGVCYEVYTLARRPGWSIIFERGAYDGWSPDEFALCLFSTGQVCQDVASYQFSNVTALRRDYEAGCFDSAFYAGRQWLKERTSA